MINHNYDKQNIINLFSIIYGMVICKILNDNDVNIKNILV